MYNCETALPVLLEKERIAELFEKFEPQKLPTKVISLYQNYFNKDSKPTPVEYNKIGLVTGIWRTTPNMEIVNIAVKQSKFLSLNNDGYLAVAKILK